MKTNLSIRQLQTFAEVMRSGSISDAARRLGRTQPAVSSTIAGLEAEIGFALFEREKKRLIPKPEAHYFLEETETVIERLTQASRTIQEVGNLKKGVLRIACNPIAANYFMPAVLAEFLEDKPGVKVSLMMRSSAVVTDWIASQQYDVGVGEWSEDRATINSRRFALRCLCAIPENSPLASLNKITPKDLVGLPLAMVHERNVLGPKIRQAFAADGVALDHRFEFESILPALKLVAEGACYLICDSFSALSQQRNYGTNSRIVFRPFEPKLFLELALMSPANRPTSQLAEAFLELVSYRLEDYASYLG